MATQVSTAKLHVRREHHTGESLTTLALRRLRRDKLTLAAITILVVLSTLAVLAEPISAGLGVDYRSTNAQQAFLPIGTPGHILGTDDLGRDQFSRLLFAGQVSLSIAFVSALLSLGIGVSLGILTGYYGGVVDDVVNWLITTLSSVPQLFLLLIISGVILNAPKSGPYANFLSTLEGPVGLIVILGILGWTGTTRLVRGETLSLREREFVISARAIGASPLRIMFVHILPNLFSVITVTLAIDIGALILTEAALSFLGLGVKAPTPSWGNMLTNSRDFFTRGEHLVILPGLLIFITVLCLYVIGDGVRDAFDPTARD